MSVKCKECDIALYVALFAKAIASCQQNFYSTEILAFTESSCNVLFWCLFVQFSVNCICDLNVDREHICLYLIRFFLGL